MYFSRLLRQSGCLLGSEPDWLAGAGTTRLVISDLLLDGHMGAPFYLLAVVMVVAVRAAGWTMGPSSYK